MSVPIVYLTDEEQISIKNQKAKVAECKQKRAEATAEASKAISAAEYAVQDAETQRRILSDEAAERDRDCDLHALLREGR